MTSLRRTAIVMSRLPRLIDPRATWLCGLRAALRRVRDEGNILVVGAGTAGCDFVRRGADRLEIPVELAVPSQENDAAPESQIPAQDRTVMETADSVIVLGLRTNGNLHHLSRERAGRAGEVILTDLPDLQSAAARDNLVEAGAELWSPSSESQLPFREAVDSEEEHITGARNAVIEIVPFPARDEWTMLSHTTRACPGPWPDQSQTEYLDSLLDDSFDADHSSVSTLARIVTQRRLIASNRTIRGGHRVVSFTAVPLLDLPPLRQFRTHRARWDFEPFGLCIRRECLERRGAQPVVYGHESCWHGLPEVDRPFFQLTATEETPSDVQAAAIDWSVEREWRHVGDFDLQALNADDVLVFVPDYVSAQRLATVSLWPITLWPDPAIEIPELRQHW